MKLNYVIIPLMTVLVAMVGSWLTSSGMDWYGTINLPEWTPAGSVIGAVWTTIFILATIAALIVWNWGRKSGIASSPSAPRNDIRKKWIIAIFLINAFLNVFWSFLFFNQHLIGLAVWEAALLGLSVLFLIILIRPISKWAALLLFPYAGWVAFATYLTYVIFSLNL